MPKGRSRRRRAPAARPDRVVAHVNDLVADPENRRGHNPRNLGMIAEALQQVGAARSIVIDEDGLVLAGNGVRHAAPGAGITKVRVIETDGQELIAVRRRGLTPEQKRALAIYDNRTAELAEWDAEQLQADRDAGLSLQPFWTEEEAAAFWPGAPGTGDAQSLQDRFGVPPFSVLDARQGYWQDRKRAWLSLGIQSELGRGEQAAIGGAPLPLDRTKAAAAARARVSPGGSARPAMQTRGGNVRGDGRGRPLA